MPTSTTSNYNPGRFGSQGFTLPPIALAAVIAHEGHLMAVATDGTGVAEPAEIAANRKILGVNKTTVDNSAGSAGDKTVEIETDCYRSFDMKSGDTFDNGDIGAIAYVHGSFTVKKTAGSNPINAGEVRGIAPDGRVIVFIAAQ